MAINWMVKFAALLLFALFAISMLESTQVSAVGLGSYAALLKKYYGPGTVTTAQCPGRCRTRCSKVKHRFDFCNAGCMSCCHACKCVPPGTTGYREVCPCYGLRKTKKGGPKCP